MAKAVGSACSSGDDMEEMVEDVLRSTTCDCRGAAAAAAMSTASRRDPARLRCCGMAVPLAAAAVGVPSEAADSFGVSPPLVVAGPLQVGPLPGGPARPTVLGAARTSAEMLSGLGRTRAR